MFEETEQYDNPSDVPPRRKKDRKTKRENRCLKIVIKIPTEVREIDRSIPLEIIIE